MAKYKLKARPHVDGEGNETLVDENIVVEAEPCKIEVEQVKNDSGEVMGHRAVKPGIPGIVGMMQGKAAAICWTPTGRTGVYPGDVVAKWPDGTFRVFSEEKFERLFEKV